MTSHRPQSFWTEARMSYGKDGKWNDDTEWRIYYFNDVLPAFLTTVIDSSLRSEWRLMVFLAMGTDTSHSLRMTLAVRCHSERRRECLVEKTGNGTMKRSEESITLMTAYRLPHHSHRSFAALRMTSYGLPYHGHRHFTFASDDACRLVSFWTEAKILCEKDRKRNSDTEWRIYYADGVTDSLPLVLLFVFLHIVFDRSYSVWRVFLYNRVFVIFMCIYNFSKIREE